MQENGALPSGPTAVVHRGRNGTVSESVRRAKGRTAGSPKV